MPSSEDQAKNIPIIKHLPELEYISDDALMQVFWGNRNTVFAYGRTDIESTLMKRDIEVLKVIRTNLCELAGEIFPAYLEKTPINRKVKN